MTSHGRSLLPGLHVTNGGTQHALVTGGACCQTNTCPHPTRPGLCGAHLFPRRFPPQLRGPVPLVQVRVERLPLNAVQPRLARQDARQVVVLEGLRQGEGATGTIRICGGLVKGLGEYEARRASPACIQVCSARPGVGL